MHCCSSPTLVSHVDKRNYTTIWSSDIIKCHSCTLHHKADKIWLQGHSLSHLITGSLKHLITLFPPSIIPSFCFNFHFIPFFYSVLALSFISSPSPYCLSLPPFYLFSSALLSHINLTLLSFLLTGTFLPILTPLLTYTWSLTHLLSPSVFSIPPLLIHSCHCLQLPCLKCSCQLLIPCLHLLLWYIPCFFPVPSCLLQLFQPSTPPSHLLFFLYLQSSCTLLPPLIYFSTSQSLPFFPFTLSDGSIDSRCDDIAQGQPRGKKPL